MFETHEHCISIWKRQPGTNLCSTDWIRYGCCERSAPCPVYCWSTQQNASSVWIKSQKQMNPCREFDANTDVVINKHHRTADSYANKLLYTSGDSAWSSGIEPTLDIGILMPSNKGRGHLARIHNETTLLQFATCRFVRRHGLYQKSEYVVWCTIWPLPQGSRTIQKLFTSDNNTIPGHGCTWPTALLICPS